jgi:hypothetical protein
MAAKTEQELRDRIAEYRSLRTRTTDKPALEAIDSIIREAERQLETLVKKRSNAPADREREEEEETDGRL